MPLQSTSGAASYDAFGGGVPAVPKYIEEYFSTFLYKGTDATQTITNNIDLSTKGGLVWIKDRTSAANHYLFDTERGATSRIFSNLTNAASTSSSTAYFQSFNNNGFTIGYANSDAASNYASWSWAKAPKFFDVVTWTGTGSSPLTVNHNLGSVPGCIIIKAFSSSPAVGQNWLVYHRSVVNLGRLNETSAFIYSGIDNVTSTSFEPGGTGSGYNVSGVQYIGYVFAHDAGGFGLTGTDNVISCGSYTGTGSSVTVDIGYEPQWILTRNVTDADDWFLFDNMRGIATGGTDAFLRPNLSNAENTATDVLDLTATGFKTVAAARHTNGKTYIYIAIRRGPMKVPTVGTSVFSPNTTSDDGNAITTGFPVDMFIEGLRAGNAINQALMDRLRGNGSVLTTSSTAAENPVGEGGFASNTTIKPGLFGGGSPAIVWNFRRAPSFFDEVCYTGDGDDTGRTITHNLTVAPELMIIKRRSAASFNGWPVYVPTSTAPRTNVCFLNTTAAATDTSYFNLTAPTSTVFSVNDHQDVNASGNTYVAYLFATCAGVSKVGRYTGTATTLQIDCGFTGGARFVLIKRTDSTGDWYVWDSARGIVSGNDPYLLLNSSAAEVTNTDYVDTYSAGFEISSTAPAAINASGGSFIFLAIS